ncbi:MAG: MarR family transcriptional regulator [Deltaproteobacteria bacterium]|jgi:DNA-binding MarR family transcriptional regulator
MPTQKLSETLNENVLICLRKIIQSIELHSRDLVKRVGLTGPQLTILIEISKNPKGVSVGEIAASISLSMGTVTGILERLEKRKLITRYKNSSDKRRVMVHLSKEGKRIIDSAPPLLQDSFVEALNNLQSWEQSMILSSLQRLVAMMNAKKIQAEPILLSGDLDTASHKETEDRRSYQ